MDIYEKRTYSVAIGKMPELFQLYKEEGWPIIEASGLGKNVVGYFTSDTGEMNQFIYLLRFESDDDRREFWKQAYSNQSLMAFIKKLRPLLLSQHTQAIASGSVGTAPIRAWHEPCAQCAYGVSVIIRYLPHA